jgi:hypothetical protein
MVRVFSSEFLQNKRVWSQNFDGTFNQLLKGADTTKEKFVTFNAQQKAQQEAFDLYIERKSSKFQRT